MHALKRTTKDKRAIFPILIFLALFFFLLLFRVTKKTQEIKKKEDKNAENTMMKLNYPYLFTLAAAL